MQNFSETLLNRFMQYVAVDTTSCQEKADAGIMPSSEGQRSFAHELAAELRSFGIEEVLVTENGYVYAKVPASTGHETAPSIAFCAHMDTVEGVCGTNVKPCLKYENDDTIITSDGSTLLGADDKAGIAEIMTAAHIMMQNETPHGQIEIIFSPDEETGHGMDKVPLDIVQSKICYTLDGSEAGEIEYECFNAYKVHVDFTGKAKHTGTARPDMVNAVTMAAVFVSLLPHNESPETTDGYYGFYAPMHINGGLEKSSVVLYLRDFDENGMNERIETVQILAKAVERRFTGGKVAVTAVKQYLNMKSELDKNPAVVHTLIQAVKNAGLEPIFKPIRGGTDGSRLTEMGIPCPNIFTGGHNFHSKGEWASLTQMAQAVSVILELISLWSKPLHVV